mmetsp:Transcript_67048/g.196077  ORF Transcript_67048/g.196077 Transcript_67048/m.196077 type:complete len:328 (-) Transcript_67048:1153-2136(-)
MRTSVGAIHRSSGLPCTVPARLHQSSQHNKKVSAGDGSDRPALLRGVRVAAAAVATAGGAAGEDVAVLAGPPLGGSRDRRGTGALEVGADPPGPGANAVVADHLHLDAPAVVPEHSDALAADQSPAAAARGLPDLRAVRGLHRLAPHPELAVDPVSYAGAAPRGVEEPVALGDARDFCDVHVLGCIDAQKEVVDEGRSIERGTGHYVVAPWSCGDRSGEATDRLPVPLTVEGGRYGIAALVPFHDLQRDVGDEHATWLYETVAGPRHRDVENACLAHFEIVMTPTAFLAMLNLLCRDHIIRHDLSKIRGIKGVKVLIEAHYENAIFL